MNHILSSAVLTAAAIPAAALASPAHAAATTIEELAEQFRESAQVLDPRINECWIGYDELAKGPREMRVMSIYFGRADTPFVASRTANLAPTMTELFEQWREARQDRAAETKDEATARLERYLALQRQILAKRPRTARDLAMQFVVETDDGDNDHRTAFLERMRLIAFGA